MPAIIVLGGGIMLVAKIRCGSTQGPAHLSGDLLNSPKLPAVDVSLAQASTSNECFSGGDIRNWLDGFRPKLVRLFSKFTSDTHTLEDLIQDTLTRLVSRMNQFDSGKAKFDTWVFTMARSVAIDHLRRQGRRPLTISSDLDSNGSGNFESVLSRRDDMEDKLDLSQSLSQIRHSLNVLSLEQYEVVVLRLANIPFDRIAEILGIPIDTGKSRFLSAKKRLKTHFSANDS